MKPYYYVFRKNSQLPTVRHETLALAQAEAERLAELHRAETFEILKAIGMSQVQGPVSTFFMEGEGPCKAGPAPTTCPPKLPKGFTEPSIQWIYAGKGIAPNGGFDWCDIAMLLGDNSWYYEVPGANLNTHYAIRINSPIHRIQPWFVDNYTSEC